jgi:hypothetical protein
MSWRYTGLSVLILLAFLAMRLPSLFSPLPKIQPAWLLPPSHDDPEGRLAMGYRLPIECANVWSLELIKGFSDTLAMELLDKRFEIMRAALDEPHLDALRRARGIGDKTAELFLRYLDLTERCTTTDRLLMWRKGERGKPPL